MSEQQAGQQVDQAVIGGEYNNNWVGVVALLIAVFLPQFFSRIWAEFAIEALVPGALFFLIFWTATSKTSKGKYRIVTAWYLAAIAITAALVGLVRFGLVFVIGGRAVANPSEFLSLLFVLVLPVLSAWVISAKLQKKVAVISVGEAQTSAGTTDKS